MHLTYIITLSLQMGIANSAPPQLFIPPVPQVLYTTKEIPWQQVSSVLSEQARLILDGQKQTHLNKKVHWSGQISMVLSNHILVKMNPGLSGNADLKLIFDAGFDCLNISPLLNQQVDFICQLNQVDSQCVTAKFLNFDIYQNRVLTQKQIQVVQQLKNPLPLQSLSELNNAPSWLEFLIDSAPNTYATYFKSLQRNLIKFFLTFQKNNFHYEEQLFQVSNLAGFKPKNGNKYEVFGQIQANEGGVIKIAMMQINEVKKFEYKTDNKIILPEEEKEKLTFYLQQGQNQRKNLMALLKQNVKEEEEVQLFKVEQMTTCNKILNNLVNKEAVLMENQDNQLFV